MIPGPSSIAADAPKGGAIAGLLRAVPSGLVWWGGLIVALGRGRRDVVVWVVLLGWLAVLLTVVVQESLLHLARGAGIAPAEPPQVTLGEPGSGA